MNSSAPETCYVVLHISNGPRRQDLQDGLRVILEDSVRFQLSENIWMERFEKELGQKIQTACDPPHYKINGPGYDRHLYAFVKRVTEPEKSKYAGMSKLASLVDRRCRQGLWCSCFCEA